ncbi:MULTISPECIES: hypothetical protein [unclassified Acinetobacter]|uniref:hypothetical protein n=1 Tax=unclassified Acinetobacter TaxID=196816 RepID=UPI000AACD58E|nr:MULTISPECIES: hypothetical protein [unclassified Acinetobacter]MCT8088907.1 hypothetical protein [Acinetobacter sp. F_3_1]MCT8097063.1 hypothetical protein [Acinetobacter sp. C_3_1]MCT8099944.1 hypothetical protein [Acinetobacter sp. C_4_1]MCT8134342.1 hypothetical protein [Acinetobacter sp. T_3_1]
MLKKFFLVLIILLPSALYLYIVSRDEAPAKDSSITPAEAPAQEQPEKYQTPDH